MGGCEKSHRDLDVNTNTVEDHSFATMIYSDVFKMVDEIALHTKGIANPSDTVYTQYGCDDIKVDTSVEPKQIIIDFGFTNCVGKFEFNRQGRIIAEFTGIYPEPEASLTITFLNYRFEDYEVEGSVSVINRSPVNGARSFSYFLQRGNILAEDETFVSFNASEVWTQTEGQNTTAVADDVFEVSGTSNGANFKGNLFSTEISTNNIQRHDCARLVDGITDVFSDNISKRRVDYGNGNCDRTAVASINGEPFSVRLP